MPAWMTTGPLHWQQCWWRGLGDNSNVFWFLDIWTRIAESHVPKVLTGSLLGEIKFIGKNFVHFSIGIKH